MPRVYVIPIRTDCPGANLQVLDLVPNTSQRNPIYDGPGQTFYLRGADCPGATTVNGDAYVSGSRMTVLTTADDATVQDTTGLGNDCRATATAQFGLAAYLRERVQPGGIALATAGRMAPEKAQALAMALMYQVYLGNNLDLTTINSILSDVGSGGTAQTDLNGASGFSKSFGSVEDILRILSGEVYLVPRYVIITNIVAGPAYEFLSLAERDVLVAAQDTGATGKTFVSRGRFLGHGESGYVDIPQIALTGEFIQSATDPNGDLYRYSEPMTFKNPSFAYSLADLQLGKAPAAMWNGAGVPASGTARVARSYQHDGTVL